MQSSQCKLHFQGERHNSVEIKPCAGIRAAGPQDLFGIKRLYQSLALDLGLMLNSLSDDDFASPLLRVFVIEREGQVCRYAAAGAIIES